MSPRSPVVVGCLEVQVAVDGLEVDCLEVEVVVDGLEDAVSMVAAGPSAESLACIWQ